MEVDFAEESALFLLVSLRKLCRRAVLRFTFSRGVLVAGPFSMILASISRGCDAKSWLTMEDDDGWC